MSHTQTHHPMSKRIFSHSATLATLLSKYSPNFQQPNKLFIFQNLLNSLKSHSNDTQTITLNKYSSENLHSDQITWNPSTLCELEIAPRPFDYIADDEQSTRWYLNFADAHLFCAYASPLFAQDELQVMEIPLLASLRENLVEISKNNPDARPCTMERSRATPCIITNVPRYVDIDTAPSKSAPRGIYGNEFVRASQTELRSRCKVLTPPQTTNIIAMASLGYQRGYYTANQYEILFLTALAAFSGALQESSAQCVIHTGLWGCGAFGMSKHVSILVQWMAASVAQVHKLYMHCVTQDDVLQVQKIIAELSNDRHPMQRQYTSVSELFAKLDNDKTYKWGMSNGT